MTSMSSVPVATRLVGLRLHRRRASGGEALPPRAQALLDLEARNRQIEADEQALRELVQTIKAQVDGVPEAVRMRLDEIAGIAVELGLAVAREIVGAALDKGQVDPTATVKRCLADCVHGSDRADLVVRLHPEDVAAVQTRLAAMPEIADELDRATITADASVNRGGVRAETGAGRLHYDPNEVLARICDEVRREASA